MADIFEIKSAEIEIKIKDKVFALRDPKFIDKINLQKEWKELTGKKESLTEADYYMAAYDLNKKMLVSYLPDMTSEFIDNDLPSSAVELLIKKITELSEQNFGAVIEKAEKK